jgi:hypothetical protein
MTPAENASETIARAVKAVTAAADRWDAVNLSEIDSCVTSLESSVADLNGALDILRQSPRLNVGTLVANIIELKNSAARLERLSDSAASFLRCAPGLESGEPTLYDAGGSMQHAAPSAEPRGMQV